MGNDTLLGGEGNDSLDGGAGIDSMTGGNGDDTYVVDSDRDIVVEVSNAGTDFVQSSVRHTLLANVENLTLTGTTSINGTGNTLANEITGNSGANSLSGGAGNDTLSGGDGNDTLDGGTGIDRMTGGSGDDTFEVDSASDVVVEIDRGGTDLVQTTLAYTLTSFFENLTLTGTTNVAGTGNALANKITGNGGANTLSGLDGNDTLSGGAGNDTLDGGAGADNLTGGTGADTFVFNQLTGTDTISDFKSGTDHINLSKAVFTGLGTTAGALGSSAFYAAAGATYGNDSSDRVVYNKTTGALYYDADGSGSGAAVQIAVLDGHPTLTYLDVLIF
jgi:Ca2+-binding RTX toxin-like protein